MTVLQSVDFLIKIDYFLLRKYQTLKTKSLVILLTMPRFTFSDELCNRVSEITGKPFTRSGDKIVNECLDILENRIKETQKK